MPKTRYLLGGLALVVVLLVAGAWVAYTQSQGGSAMNRNATGSTTDGNLMGSMMGDGQMGSMMGGNDMGSMMSDGRMEATIGGQVMCSDRMMGSATGTNSGTGEVPAATEEGSEQATTSYLVPTITCPSCAARVEANAEKDPGVLDAQVEGQRVTVTYDPAKTDPEKIAEAIRNGGDTVRPDE